MLQLGIDIDTSIAGSVAEGQASLAMPHSSIRYNGGQCISTKEAA
jgi:hypothetical protein